VKKVKKAIKKEEKQRKTVLSLYVESKKIENFINKYNILLLLG
jgi:hypothetical protein